MLTSVLGSTADTRFVASSKALEPMVVTVLGRTMCTRAVQPQKAFWGRDVVEESMTTCPVAFGVTWHCGLRQP